MVKRLSEHLHAFWTHFWSVFDSLPPSKMCFSWEGMHGLAFHLFQFLADFYTFLKQKRLHFETFCPPKRLPTNKQIPSDPHRPLEDPFELPWGPFRTLEGSLGDPFGPRRLPWGPFRALEGSLGDPVGPRRLPWGPFRALEGSLGVPFGPSKAPRGNRNSRNGRATGRQGYVKGPMSVACSPQGKGAEAT